MGALAINPEYEALFNEVKELRREISELFEERDALRFHVCRNIESEYMQKIGVWEYKAYEFQCKVLRIKRKIELIQMKINRQEIIFIPRIEEQLDEEYKEYEEKLREKLNDINDALEWGKRKEMSENDSAELKKEYRKIVKKLHPDINPDITEEEKSLFYKAVEAYENGDLETVKSISLLISEISPSEEKITDGFEKLKEQRDGLIKLRDSVLEQLEQIKSSFPYNQRELLADERKVSERREELNKLTAEYKELYKKYEEKLNELLGG